MDSLDYKKLVFDTYHHKVKKGKLTLNLVELKPAGLRDECLEICKSSFNPKDEMVLKSFFGSFRNKEECEHKINNVNITKFKPFANFLNGDTEEPKGKVIEILAWMIDFWPRPYHEAVRYSEQEIRARMESEAEEVADKEQPAFNDGKKQEETRKENGIEIESEKEKGDQSSMMAEVARELRKGEDYRKELKDGKESVDVTNNMPSFVDDRGSVVQANIESRKRRRILIGLFIFFFLLGGSWGIWKIMTRNGVEIAISKSPTPQKYMYWAGEEYKELNNAEKVKGIIVILYDSTRFFNFRKIMDPSTITPSDIKNVWYTKFQDGSIEYYTGKGNHPVDTSRILKQLTPYMYKTHIEPLKTQSQN